MKKKLSKAKIIFLALFALLLGMCIYDDAIHSKPRCLINIGIMVFMMNSYIEKKEYIKALKEKNELYEMLHRSFEANSPDIMVYFDNDQKIITCNKTMCDTFGIENPDDAKNLTMFDYLPPEKASVVQRYNNKVLLTGKPIKYTIDVNNKTNGTRTFETVAVPIQKNDEIKGLVAICRDVTFREKLRSKYIEQQNQLNSILDNLPLAAFLIDTEGKYINGNSKIDNLLNIKESTLKGCDIFTKYLYHTKKEIQTILKTVKKEKCTVACEHFYKFPNRSPNWYKIYKAPICNRDGNISAFTVFVQNIGAEKNLTRQKEQFIATLRHDLKTPVIAQIRSLELLLRGEYQNMTDEQVELLNLTLDSSKQMYNLVSTILYSYKFDNAEVKLDPQEVNIMEIILECCNTVSKMAAGKEAEIIITPGENIGKIQADKNYLKYAILYMIENSISYAFEKTKIVLNLREENGKISFTIHTTGHYIPQEEIDMMFDQYLGQTQTYNKIGFCLKLYYSSQIINAHNGQIIAYSDPSNRNILGFTIPLIHTPIPVTA